MDDAREHEQVQRMCTWSKLTKAQSCDTVHTGFDKRLAEQVLDTDIVR